MPLEVPHESCEFEKKRLFAFVDNLHFGPEDIGNLFSIQLSYKPELV